MNREHSRSDIKKIRTWIKLAFNKKNNNNIDYIRENKNKVDWTIISQTQN